MFYGEVVADHINAWRSRRLLEGQTQTAEIDPALLLKL